MKKTIAKIMAAAMVISSIVVPTTDVKAAPADANIEDLIMDNLTITDADGEAQVELIKDGKKVDIADSSLGGKDKAPLL